MMIQVQKDQHIELLNFIILCKEQEKGRHTYGGLGVGVVFTLYPGQPRAPDGQRWCRGAQPLVSGLARSVWSSVWEWHLEERLTVAPSAVHNSSWPRKTTSDGRSWRWKSTRGFAIFLAERRAKKLPPTMMVIYDRFTFRQRGTDDEIQGNMGPLFA